MEFEWDNNKVITNLQKHGVSFAEAATVFGDPLSITFPDPDHSINENRFVTIGLSTAGKIIILSHTDRGDRIRIISARKTTRKEQKFYEEGY
jgi:uncharacterized DUF497 family protein